MGWEELVESSDGLETKDVYDGYFCSVKDAVAIIILGSLCGLQNFKQIHEWAATEHIRAFLENEFNIKRIPCCWWLLSLTALVTPESLNLCMKKWVSRIAPGLAEKIVAEEKKPKKKTQLTVAIDGKEVRSTEKMDKYDSPLHIASAQIGELGLALAQEAVDGKSNEIPAVRKLIKSLEISGCIVAADALKCQIDTAQAVLDGACRLSSVCKRQSAESEGRYKRLCYG
ncbi:ISAs1 family transposase [Treponema sp.]|uniref:ISAs1 family transposase n=1 Tax=Treponema sp. TaxID=166 RepID=UPI003F056123